MVSQPELMRGPTGGQLSDSSRQQAKGDFLGPQTSLANVVGFGHGVKWINGEPTGEPAVMVFVTQKVPESMLPERDVIPSQMDDGTPTDVVAVGHVAAQRQQRKSGRTEDRSVTYGPDGGVSEQLGAFRSPCWKSSPDSARSSRSSSSAGCARAPPASRSATYG